MNETKDVHETVLTGIKRLPILRKTGHTAAIPVAI